MVVKIDGPSIEWQTPLPLFQTHYTLTLFLTTTSPLFHPNPNFLSPTSGMLHPKLVTNTFGHQYPSIRHRFNLLIGFLV